MLLFLSFVWYPELSSSWDLTFIISHHLIIFYISAFIKKSLIWRPQTAILKATMRTQSYNNFMAAAQHWKYPPQSIYVVVNLYWKNATKKQLQLMKGIICLLNKFDSFQFLDSFFIP